MLQFYAPTISLRNSGTDGGSAATRHAYYYGREKLFKTHPVAPTPSACAVSSTDRVYGGTRT
eukprot:919716-Rhodomonas_salina.3